MERLIDRLQDVAAKPAVQPGQSSRAFQQAGPTISAHDKLFNIFAHIDLAQTYFLEGLSIRMLTSLACVNSGWSLLVDRIIGNAIASGPKLERLRLKAAVIGGAARPLHQPMPDSLKQVHNRINPSTKEICIDILDVSRRRFRRVHGTAQQSRFESTDRGSLDSSDDES